MTTRQRRLEYTSFWNQMKPYVALIVGQSFADEKMQNPTGDEIKRRATMAKTIVDILRNDLSWSKQRIRDHLYVILKARLIGLELDIERLGKRSSW